jgi:uncharacterized membrane protein YfcA
MAQGTSLGILLLPAGFLGVIQYYKQGYVDFKVVAIVTLGFVFGNFLGSKFALTISDAILKKIFAVVLILVAIKILFFDKIPATKVTINNTPENTVLKQ